MELAEIPRRTMSAGIGLLTFCRAPAPGSGLVDNGGNRSRFEKLVVTILLQQLQGPQAGETALLARAGRARTARSDRQNLRSADPVWTMPYFV